MMKRAKDQALFYSSQEVCVNLFGCYEGLGAIAGAILDGQSIFLCRFDVKGRSCP
jgi:hypothetical protein